MKRLFILLLLTAGTTAIFAQKAKEAEQKIEHKNMVKTLYTCPMHSDELSTKPGTCSKCSSN